MKLEKFVLAVLIVWAVLLACVQPYSARRTTEMKVDNLPPDSLAQKRLAREIRKLIGAEYREGGHSQAGMDCSGLVYTIFKNALNLTLPRTTRQLAKTGQRLSARSLHFGDLVFFRSERSNRISHVGIYIEHGQFVHASTSKGVMISDLDEPYYAHLFMMARRVMVPARTLGREN